MSQLSPGDLAVILRSDTYPECVGWHVTAVGPSEYPGHWVIEHAPTVLTSMTRTYIPPEWLRRVPPLDELADVKHEEELHAA